MDEPWVSYYVLRITERGRARLVEMQTIPVVKIPSGLTSRRGRELAGEKWRLDVPAQFRGAAEGWLRHALETGGSDLGVWQHVKSFLRWHDCAYPGTPNLVDVQPLSRQRSADTSQPAFSTRRNLPSNSFSCQCDPFMLNFSDPSVATSTFPGPGKAALTRDALLRWWATRAGFRERLRRNAD